MIDPPFFVVNPQSANGLTGRRWNELEAKIRRRFGDCHHVFTQSPMHAVQLTVDALAQGRRSIVSVGGDGTLNEVVNGFLKESERESSQATLGLVSRGTGGDFGKTFGWNHDFDSALERIQRGNRTKLDVGKIEYVDHQGAKASRHFLNVCSMGVSGLVDREVNSTSKWLGGRASFFLGSTKALIKYSDKSIRFRVDGGDWQHSKITALAAGNGKYFGGGMCVAPGADPSDGMFHITLWSGFGLRDFVFKAKSIYDGSHVRWEGTQVLQCKTLEAESDEEVLVDVDGEQPGRLPCRITLQPARLPFFV